MKVEIEELWWARVASLFDAEGSIRKTQACFDIAMCDQDLIQMCKDVTGVDKKICERVLPSGKTQYRIWFTGKATVKRCLTRMLPYLGKRRTEQALTLLQWIDKSPNNSYA